MDDLSPALPLGVMVWFRVKPENREWAIQMSTDYAAESVEVVPGCRRHDVVQDAQDDCKFSFYKIFDDQQAFDDHKKTESFAAAHSDEAKAAWIDGRVSFTSPIFPKGDVNWDSVEQPGPRKRLQVYQAALAFHPARADDAESELTRIAQESLRDDTGCLRSDVHRSRKDPAEFWVYEVYEDRDAFDYHQRVADVQEGQKTMAGWYADGSSPTDKHDVVCGPSVWPPGNWSWQHSMK